MSVTCNKLREVVAGNEGETLGPLINEACKTDEEGGAADPILHNSPAVINISYIGILMNWWN